MSARVGLVDGRQMLERSVSGGVLDHPFETQAVRRGMQNLSKTGQDWWDSFQELLEDQIDFPSEYLFKFIVPSSNLDELKSVFGDHPVEVRQSRKGNYVSVTARMHMSSSDEVISVYSAAADVDDVISL